MSLVTPPLDDDLLAHIARGWRLLPVHTMAGGRCSCGRSCSSPGKHPRTANGLKDASADEAAVRRWLARWPGTNWAVATGAVSGLVVLDVDGVAGYGSLAALERRRGRLPWSARVLTGSGGLHIHLRHPGGNVPNSAGRLGRGLDVRGDGGYCLLPPSLHASGRRYRWLGPVGELATYDLSPDPAPVPPRSDLAGTVRSVGDRYAARALEAEVAAVAAAVEGTRNDTLNRAAFSLGTLVAMGLLDEAEVGAALCDAAIAAGLAHTEATQTIRSGLRAGLAHPRTLR